MFKTLLALVTFAFLSACSTLQVEDTVVVDHGVREVSVLGVITESTSIQEQVDKINSDPKARVAIVFINSGGGGVTASIEDYAALAELKVPAVAYCYEVCASGAMLLAMSPTIKEIYGSPGVICGSIGVIMNLVRQKVPDDIIFETYRSGILKQANSHPGPATEEEKKYLQQQIDEMAQEFYGFVNAARGSKISPESWKDIKTARIFFDKKCVDVGLLDGIMTKKQLVDQLTFTKGSN